MRDKCVITVERKHSFSESDNAFENPDEESDYDSNFNISYASNTDGYDSNDDLQQNDDH